jgi:hypothetical protein
VPDCVNTAVNAVEATGGGSLRRAVLVDAGGPKLGQAHHSVLPGGDLGDAAVGIGALVADMATKAPIAVG